MDLAKPEIEGSSIAAHSERQAMDWSLVLASQDIPAAIAQPDRNKWALVVSPSDHQRALQAIRLFRLENRGWGWKHPLPWSGAAFHWGGLPWCLALAFVYRLSAVELPVLRTLGRFDAAAAQQGEWWRFFSAVLLHADLAHLLANLTTGILLLGLALARFRPGSAFLATYLAGACGNAAGYLFYPSPYLGLGASGMVMGALGLISVQSLADWPRGPHGQKQFLRTLLGGLLLFVLLGFNPKSDVIAHIGGFAGGVVFGAALLLLPSRISAHPAFDKAAWIVFIGLLSWTSWLVLFGLV